MGVYIACKNRLSFFKHRRTRSKEKLQQKKIARKLGIPSLQEITKGLAGSTKGLEGSMKKSISKSPQQRPVAPTTGFFGVATTARSSQLRAVAELRAITRALTTSPTTARTSQLRAVAELRAVVVTTGGQKKTP